mmetsp:Transcript_1886/g.4931  ORF Transcript_1886/g.4931 Transcript_1886/m.4931 type:complete len:471 (+) Transcript_1886:49-1461(+)
MARTIRSIKTLKRLGQSFLIFILTTALSFFRTRIIKCESSAWDVEAISVPPKRWNQYHFADIGGITSVHHLSQDSSFMIGTKKGCIYHSVNKQKKNKDATNNNDFDSVTGNERISADTVDKSMHRLSEVTSKEYKTKYPIYSIAAMPLKGTNLPSSSSSSKNETLLFFGSGDRWISVWKVETRNSNDRIRNFENDAPNFEFVQKLGPHTGWVKDLVFDDRSGLLHSIGCNCIETWNCSRVDTGHVHRTPLPIVHSKKRAIENSPTVGATLSSDLLCLVLISSNTQGSNEVPQLLVSGGVDGRIHLWLSDPTVACKADLHGQKPLHTALAHHGRVNSIVYSSAINAIYTVGNDGLLSVFRVSLNNGFEFISKLRIEEDLQGNSSRLTVASITKDLEEQNKCSLMLGSSKGELHFVTSEINTEGEIETRFERDRMTVAENSMVYSISTEGCTRSISSCRIWVGHASGLVVLD